MDGWVVVSKRDGGKRAEGKRAGGHMCCVLTDWWLS